MLFNEASYGVIKRRVEGGSQDGAQTVYIGQLMTEFTKGSSIFHDVHFLFRFFRHLGINVRYLLEIEVRNR